MQERIYEVQSSFHQGTPGAGDAAAPSAPDKFLFDAVYSGGPPWELAPGVVLANSLCIGAVYFLLWAATGYPAVCCLLLHILCGVWGAANYFVALYRGTPVLPWDLTALGTAAAVSGSYSFSPTGPMLAGIALVALLAWLLRHKFREGRFLIDRRTAPSAVSPWSWASSA